MKLINPSSCVSLQVARKNFARWADAAEGNVSYTGVGFKPKMIYIMACIDGENAVSHGFSVAEGEDVCLYYAVGDTAWYFGDEIITNVNIDWNGATGRLVTFDSDGFTLAWTKLGAWHVMINAYALCIG